MIVVGLTGSIGSGKSFIINFFKSKQIPIYCADNEVKKILDKDVYTKRKIIKIFPSACVNKKIDKNKLSSIVFNDKKKLKKLESIIHPKVGKTKKNFLFLHKKKKSPIVVLEIPILFETKGHKNCNYTILVTVNKKEQLKRIMKRKNMNREKLNMIMKNQMPEKRKKKLADFVINNSFSKKKTLKKAASILNKILSTDL